MSELLTREEIEALLACFSVENNGMSQSIEQTSAEADAVATDSDDANQSAKNVLEKPLNTKD